MPCAPYYAGFRPMLPFDGQARHFFFSGHFPPWPNNSQFDPRLRIADSASLPVASQSTAVSGLSRGRQRVKIAVLGGGHGSYAAAAEITERGHEVWFWRRDADAFAP